MKKRDKFDIRLGHILLYNIFDIFIYIQFNILSHLQQDFAPKPIYYSRSGLIDIHPGRGSQCLTRKSINFKYTIMVENHDGENLLSAIRLPDNSWILARCSCPASSRSIVRTCATPIFFSFFMSGALCRIFEDPLLSRQSIGKIRAILRILNKTGLHHFGYTRIITHSGRRKYVNEFSLTGKCGSNEIIKFHALLKKLFN